MRKLISFTLYGDDPKYVVGMYKNLELHKTFYPDWEIIIYHDNSLTSEAIDQLNEHGATLRNVDGCGIYAAGWRFMANNEEDVERFIVRDSDSRFSQREVDAVQEWEEGGKILHIMRDHPHHGYPIMGGMWGMVADPKMNIRERCLRHQGGPGDNITEASNWSMKDMHFLRDVVYRTLGREEYSKIHAAKDYMDKVPWDNEPWAEDFPNPRNEDKNFVGEIFSIQDGVETRDYQYKEV